MILIVDGKKIPVQNDVKVVYPVEYDDSEGNPCDGILHATLNCEGLILDLYDEMGDACLRTAALEVTMLEGMCH